MALLEARKPHLSPKEREQRVKAAAASALKRHRAEPTEKEKAAAHMAAKKRYRVLHRGKHIGWVHHDPHQAGKRHGSEWFFEHPESGLHVASGHSRAEVRQELIAHHEAGAPRPEPSLDVPKPKRKPLSHVMRGRKVQRTADVQQLEPGDLVRFSRPGRRQKAEVRVLNKGTRVMAGHDEERIVQGHGHQDEVATIIAHSRGKKGQHRALVHVHSTGEILQIEHGHVTHTKKQTKQARRGSLTMARLRAQGQRGATQHLETHDPERRAAASHARHVDEALRRHRIALVGDDEAHRLSVR